MPFMHYYHASASHELWFHVAGLSGPYGVWTAFQKKETAHNIECLQRLLKVLAQYTDSSHMRSLLRVAPGKVVLVTHLEETSFSNLLTEQVANELAWVHITEPYVLQWWQLSWRTCFSLLRKFQIWCLMQKVWLWNIEMLVCRPFSLHTSTNMKFRFAMYGFRHWPWQVFWFLQV